MRFKRVLPLLGLLTVSAGSAGAQGVSLWLGAGRPVGDSGAVSFKTSNLYAGVQLDVPLLPIALRAEGLMTGTDFKNAPKNYMASAVVPLRLPGITPYAIAGYGAYSYGKPAEVRGYNYGAGVRFGLGRTGLFGEVRRHDKLNKTVGTIGITL
ncbi:MAG: hypothetical protein ACT4P7_20560 [Gemmatimonadaceae bacterium]